MTQRPVATDHGPDAAADAGFRLAHFSDAHIPQHGRFAPSELLGKRGLSALNWARSRRRVHVKAVADALRADILAHKPDHIAMTGDVTNFGLKREFAAGAAWLGEAAPGDDLSFVPGNHEAIHSGVEAERDDAFAPFTHGDDGAPGFPYLRRRGPVALIGVSTSIATAPFLAQGEVGAAQSAALQRALREAKGLFRIVLIHHPPTAVSIPRRALRDREPVAAAIAEAGAELVLHGHNHRHQMSWIDCADGRRTPVLGAPAASTPAGGSHEPAEWRLLTIREGGLDIERRAVGADGAFATVGRFTLAEG